MTEGKNAGDFLRLLGNGRDFGLRHPIYTYQEADGRGQDSQKEGADTQRYAVAEVRGNSVIGIEDEPKNPNSDYAVIGI